MKGILRMVVKIAYPHGQNMGDTLLSLYYLYTFNVQASVGSTWVVSIDHTASVILGFSFFYYVPPPLSIQTIGQQQWSYNVVS